MRVQPPDSRAFSIYNLQPETEYEFQVFATNALGRGPDSETVSARTKSKAEVENLASKLRSAPKHTKPKPTHQIPLLPAPIFAFIFFFFTVQTFAVKQKQK